MISRKMIYTYAYKNFQTKPDRPFRKFPSYEALRREDNRKIYGLIMDVKRRKLGIAGDPDEVVDILNVKCTEDMKSFLIGMEGVLPCYHMHAGSWVSLVLDGSVKKKLVFDLLDMSYELTGPHPKTRKTAAHNANWIVPANPKYYDIEKAIAEGNGTFLWKQSNSILPGDTVYLYIAAPVSAIRYRCRVLESDIRYVYADENVRMDRVMRLELLKTYEDTAFSYAVLKEHGVTAIRGPRSIPDSLLKELHRA